MRKKIIPYLMVAIGDMFSAIAINMFLVPHHLLSGGFSGIAIIFHFLYDLPIGLQLFVVNIPLLYAAWRLIGREYLLVTLYGMTLFSLFTDGTAFMTQWNIVDDPMLASIYGGVVGGLGLGIIFRVNGSAGGTDIVSAIVKKYYGFSMGSVGFAANSVVVIAGAALFNIKLAMFTLLSVYISAQVTDRIVEGFNHKKTIMIISDYTDDIASSVMHNLVRGVTIWNGEGAFTHHKRQIIFVVVSLTQIAKVKLIIQHIDPKAFMIVQNAAEVMGAGFTRPLKKLEEKPMPADKPVAMTDEQPADAHKLPDMETADNGQNLDKK